MVRSDYGLLIFVVGVLLVSIFGASLTFQTKV